MTSLAPVLQTFFTERLIQQRNASPHTIASYRDTFRLLLAFTQERTGKAPYLLDIADLDAVLIGAFLTYLETDRGVSIRTRNARLTAIRSLFSYAALRNLSRRMRPVGVRRLVGSGLVGSQFSRLVG